MPSAQLPCVKTEIAVIDVRCMVPIKRSKSDLLDFDVDLAKVSAMVGEENTLFANIDTPDLGDDDDSASELGDYELAYLHSLYQPSDILSTNNNQDSSDSMLPEPPASIGAAIAPPSLGTSHLISAFTLPTPPASNSSCVSHIAAVRAASPPNTPPRGSQDVWESDNEEEEGHEHEPSSRGASPLPAGPVASTSAPMTPPGKYNATRKRKAPAHFADSAPSPQTKKRAGAAEEKADARSKKEAKRAAEAAAAAIKEEEGSDYDSSDSDGPSDSLLLDGLEIRPEDDPLGLFQKDPATLTPEEQRIVKKQRRLLKNRESAQLSRHRKKMHLHTLEKQVDALKKEKAALAGRIAELADENARIRKLCPA
ncbi:hypothetical protein T484DRAFT_1982040 [Baffinella frigidus]|nr:hypothetical protein T484DRAFT_1982038 [Cryptophyta sp. CCMP2293]KAJ1469564.1 hypothetical protein T484DRAFT_1982040 [Cryptophyta sp. CCMP2293]